MDTPANLTPHENPFMGVEELLDFSGHFSFFVSCSDWLVVVCSICYMGD
jgi:hypothetical protein